MLQCVISTPLSVTLSSFLPNRSKKKKKREREREREERERGGRHCRSATVTPETSVDERKDRASERARKKERKKERKKGRDKFYLSLSLFLFSFFCVVSLHFSKNHFILLLRSFWVRRTWRRSVKEKLTCLSGNTWRASWPGRAVSCPLS